MLTAKQARALIEDRRNVINWLDEKILERVNEGQYYLIIEEREAPESFATLYNIIEADLRLRGFYVLYRTGIVEIDWREKE